MGIAKLMATRLVTGVLLILVLGMYAASALAQGIPITFSMEAPGYVSLVLEDADGHRIRNLLQDSFYSSGEHTVFWDGYDAGLPTARDRNEGNYAITRTLVTPGSYRVKALVHDDISLRYEFSVQSPGNPPWHTFDDTGGWLSDHQSAWDVVLLPPGATDFSAEPLLLFTAKTAEAGDGIMLVDEDGRKVYGLQSLPGGFYAGHNVARDKSLTADPEIAAVMSIVEGDEMRLYRFRRNGKVYDNPVAFPVNSDDDEQLKGLAVYNGVAAVSLHLMGQIVFINLVDGTAAGVVANSDPRGLFVSEDQRLYVIEGGQVVRYDADFSTATLTGRTVLVGDGLDDPQSVTVDGDRMYIGDWGTSHQVKVFDLAGTLVQTIGSPGGPQIGLYDESRMAYPRGLAVDGRGKLWVAERHKAPKRISRWDAASGAFDHAWYGPPKYGGGGMIDPVDPTRFYYSQSGKDEKKRTYEFGLDWSTGESRVTRVLVDDEHFPTGDIVPYRAPEYARYVGGREYLANNNQEEPNGNRVCSTWLFENDRLWPVTVAGIVSKWDVLNAAGDWQAFGNDARKVFFVWSDLDRDGYVGAGETQYRGLEHWQGTCFVEKDLSITSIWGDKLSAPEIDSNGVPHYDFGTWTTISSDAFGDDKDSYHVSDDSLFVSLIGPISFFNHGELIAQYHSQWPNRNIGGAPVPVQQFPGQLTNTGRPLGDLVVPGAGESGPILGINSEFGQAYLLTWDGIYITQLLDDARTSPLWRFDAGIIGRDDVVDGVSGNREHFWPTLNATSDGNVYFVAGKEHSSILRVEGLASIRRLDMGVIDVSEAMLAGKPLEETEGVEPQEKKLMTAQIVEVGNRTDGLLGDWEAAGWVTLDDVDGTRAALAADDDSLYLVVQSDLPDLLNNSGQDGYQLNFSTGGGIDLWLGANSADETRTEAAQGDVRIFITRENGDPLNGPLRATLYEKVHPDSRDEDGYSFVSAIDEVNLDLVKDITTSVTFAQNEDIYEAAVPLSVLGIEPAPGNEVWGDIGVFVGDGQETRRRIYWNNKSWVTVSDIAREAEFKPEYLGIISLVAGGVTTGTDDGASPRSFRLEVGYPNPVRSSTTIRYELAEPRVVEMDVYDVLGRRVARLVNSERRPAGLHAVRWDARNVASGMYFYRLTAGDFVSQRSVVVVK